MCAMRNGMNCRSHYFRGPHGHQPQSQVDNGPLKWQGRQRHHNSCWHGGGEGSESNRCSKSRGVGRTTAGPGRATGMGQGGRE